MQQNSHYVFRLSFKGQLVENSVDAHDVATTIMALSKIVQEISDIKYGEETTNNLKININAFREGSLETEFLMYLKDTAELLPAMIPYANNAFQLGKDLLNTYKTYIEIRKALKGEQPTEIKALSGNRFQLIVKGDNNNVSFNLDAKDLRVLQSKTIEKNTEKVVQPLTKEDSELDKLVIFPDDNEDIGIAKDEAGYLQFTDVSQVIPTLKYKGVISKVDTKACSGYIDVGSRRIPFNFPKDLKQDMFELLIESLRTRIQIYIVGEVSMDYESNPKHIQVVEVQSELKLFE